MKLQIFWVAIIIAFGIFLQNVYAINYVDHTGYTPDWAQSMGSYQALDRCNGIAGENSADGNWCMEWIGSVIDQGPNSFNPQASSYQNPSYTQNIPLTISKSSLTEFLPTSDNIGTDYQMSPVIGLGNSSTFHQTLSNLGVIDLVSQNYWKTKSNNTLVMTAMITKFNSDSNASAFYDKKIAYVRDKMDSRFSRIDTSMSSSDKKCTGIITFINLEFNNPNNNSENDEWYCVKNNFVVYTHGRLDWQQSGESGPLPFFNISDLENIMINKIDEKYSNSNTLAIIPDEAKTITQSWAQGSLTSTEFFQKIQQLLDNGKMVIPKPDPSLFNGTSTSPSPTWDYVMNVGLDKWAHGIDNKTSTIIIWQYCIAAHYLTEKSWGNVSQNSTIYSNAGNAQNVPQNVVKTPSDTNQIQSNSDSHRYEDLNPGYIALGMFVVIVLPAIIIFVIVWKVRKYLSKRRNNKIHG
ncbi:MAG: hypothetical protein ABI342_09790 [Nitrososphaera sp.]